MEARPLQRVEAAQLAFPNLQRVSVQSEGNPDQQGIACQNA